MLCSHTVCTEVFRYKYKKESKLHRHSQAYEDAKEVKERKTNFDSRAAL